MTVDRVRLKTPHPCPPPVLIEVVSTLADGLPSFDRVSVGFPGMVRRGCIITAPNLSTSGGAGSPTVEDVVKSWRRFDLAAALEERLGAPTRVVNDADLQGLGVVNGKGLECVITLGTGMGSSYFLDGVLAPHLELAHHPFRKGETYEQQVGSLARTIVGGMTTTARRQT
jgi:polyphosphate glucokinase